MTTGNNLDSALLPVGFEDFAPFLRWAETSNNARSALKMSSTFAEVKALYDHGMQNDRLSAALQYCDKFPLDDMPQAVATLFAITLSMAEVRPQVEMYGVIAPKGAAPPSRLPRTPESDVL